MEYEETITITIVHAVTGKTEALALLSSATLLELAQLSMGLFGLNSSINLMKDGVLLDSSKTLLEAGVKNGDILSAHEFFGLKSDIPAASNASVAQLDFSSLLSGAIAQSTRKNIGSEPESYFYPGMSLDEAIHHNSHPRSFAKILMENESLFKELNYHHPLLAEKMKHKSLEEITSLWRDEIVKGSIRAAHSYTERAMNEENMRKRLSGNPADVEALQFFKDKESTDLINTQYQNVMENYPESMGKILMLYIDTTVNGVSIQAFVDSGAQSTIMTQSYARLCGIDHLIDKRFSGKAVGVGTGIIIGKIHLVDMKIGTAHFPVTITVMEKMSSSNDMKFLLGLDNLRRFACRIDLEENALIFKLGSGNYLSTPFLAEKDLDEEMGGTKGFDAERANKELLLPHIDSEQDMDVEKEK